MWIEEFVKRQKFLKKLTEFSDLEDDEIVIVIIKDKRMPLAAKVKCPSLVVLWHYIRKISDEFDEDNIEIYLKKEDIKYERIIFPLQKNVKKNKSRRRTQKKVS